MIGGALLAFFGTADAGYLLAPRIFAFAQQAQTFPEAALAFTIENCSITRIDRIDGPGMVIFGTSPSGVLAASLIEPKLIQPSRIARVSGARACTASRSAGAIVSSTTSLP